MLPKQTHKIIFSNKCRFGDESRSNRSRPNEKRCCKFEKKD